MLLTYHYEASARRVAFHFPENTVWPFPVSAPTQKTIVLVDDEKSYLTLLTQLLSDHLDCRVVAFSRPLDALAALPGLEPGVIVTDYYMPQLNGVEFINQASVLAPGIPFILITGHPIGLINRDELARLTPLKSILLKPFNWRKLSDEIVRLWPEPGVIPTRTEPFPISA